MNLLGFDSDVFILKTKYGFDKDGLPTKREVVLYSYEIQGIPTYLCERTRLLFAKKAGLPATAAIREIRSFFENRKEVMLLSREDIEVFFSLS